MIKSDSGPVCFTYCPCPLVFAADALSALREAAIYCGVADALPLAVVVDGCYSLNLALCSRGGSPLLLKSADG